MLVGRSQVCVIRALCCDAMVLVGLRPRWNILSDADIETSGLCKQDILLLCCRPLWIL